MFANQRACVNSSRNPQCDARLNWCLSMCLTFNLVPCDLLCRGGVDQPFRQHQLSDYALCGLHIAEPRIQWLWFSISAVAKRERDTHAHAQRTCT